MISYDKKAIFVHIPRTGGASVETVVWPDKKDRTRSNLWMGFVGPYHNKYQTGGLQHLFARHILQEVGREIYDEFFKFTIVRNPWDKSVSQYMYMKRRKDLRALIGMSENDSFRKYLDLIQHKPHVQWDEQYKFVYDDNGNRMVDFIGRFENYEYDVNQILSILGIETGKLPHLNKSNRSRYSDYYDVQSRRVIEKLFEKDIDLFKYNY